VRLVNAYGPTETVVTATLHTVDGDFDPAAGHGVPIGRPLGARTVYAVDRRGELVPPGAPGELALGGLLARGYLGRPAATAERFRPDPFGGEVGGRLYLSGDRVRFRDGGLLEFLGRIDGQLKVRGFRVEPGEVEAALEALPAVAEAAVGVAGEADARRLVAWVVAAEGDVEANDVDADALRHALGERLPAYLVPDEWIFLERLPRLPSAKVDRRALPAPGRAAPAATAATPPRGELERRVAAIWARVLGVERVGVDDNFFDLGGHSLLLLRVHRALRRELGAGLALVELFDHPTVASLAARLGGEAAVRSAPAVRRRQRGDDDRIAVVGLGVRFPDAADGERFWDNLRRGHESVRRHERAELVAAGVPEEVLDDPRFVPASAPLADADRFDAPFFSMTPREAELLDPQQRVFLETCWSALEDAGIDPRRKRDGRPAAGRIGLFAGVGASSYLLRNLATRPDVVRSAGLQALVAMNDKDGLAPRVAYKLGLTGPAVVVQTACSTSLVAIHLACRALAAGDADVVLAGGVTLLVPSPAGYLHEEGGILSADGHCRAFDARADGTVPGSGAGVVVLKRLAD
ncbi:MAG TPA: beta-ketoacyl synthase N-terminal-like domain-containing protein, partial [Thermoanaerobaculia bacterium]|nr:beta-ketoacyl synthase N-terminal-like domain-containing protein [Thermoanaerobaculia bacterium]